MRIIAGRLKGRRLEAPRWAGLRPTSDKLRETLFNILAPRVAGARVLDAFAGTGAIGLEALSRGAGHVTFIERDPRAAALIRENVRRCGVESACVIIRGTTERAARTLAGTSFDVIVLDPPYAADVAAALGALAGHLTPDGTLVVEHARRVAPPAGAGPLARARTVTSGDSALSFYERR